MVIVVLFMVLANLIQFIYYNSIFVLGDMDLHKMHLKEISTKKESVTIILTIQSEQKKLET